MERTPHELNKAYNYNYLHDAAHLYWAARWIEMNKSIAQSDKLIDELIIRRLRKDAERLMKQGIKGLELVEEMKSPSEGMELMKQLVGEIVK